VVFGPFPPPVAAVVSVATTVPIALDGAVAQLDTPAKPDVFGGPARAQSAETPLVRTATSRWSEAS
jgi:hypothetical protein